MSEELTLGKRIKQVRESMGFTQVQFAKLIAVTQPFLARLETDKQDPSMTIVRFGRINCNIAAVARLV